MAGSGRRRQVQRQVIAVLGGLGERKVRHRGHHRRDRFHRARIGGATVVVVVVITSIAGAGRVADDAATAHQAGYRQVVGRRGRGGCHAGAIATGQIVHWKREQKGGTLDS